jgi:hypothetical protein
MFSSKAVAYTSKAPFRRFTLELAPCTHKHATRLERLARDKHSSLLRKFVIYGRKKCFNVDFRFFGKVKFGQPETETEAEEAAERPSRKKANRKKRFD